MRFRWYDFWWPCPKVKVTKSRVKGHKMKHWHVSRKLLKLQSPNLAQRYLVRMRFPSYIKIWPWPWVKVKRSRSKVTKSDFAIFLGNYWSYGHQIWHKGTLPECASDDNTYDDLDRRSRSQRSRSEKETLACFSETIEATVTKFGTKVLCQLSWWWSPCSGRTACGL